MDAARLYKLYRQSNGISTNSRDISKGEIFFALRGDHFDGNRFAVAALASGASHAVVDDTSLAGDVRYILVKDVLLSLQELAKIHRQQMDIPLIAITGSNGKTTTKELLHAVLSERYRVHSTSGNLNNHIGVPLTILAMEDSAGIAVIEMGANHAGEIRQLCEIALPDYGIITNIGKAHLEGFGSIEGVRTAKGELYNHLEASGGVVFCHGGNRDLKEMLEGYEGGLQYYGMPGTLSEGRVEEKTPLLRVSLILPGEKGMQIQTLLTGEYNLENILAASAIGHHFGISASGIRQALECYEPRANRSQRIETSRNILILDAYNANPTSMNSALDSFQDIDHPGKALIIGEMLELGASSGEEHQYLVNRLAEMGAGEVYLAGEIFRGLDLPADFKVFPDSGKLKQWLQDHPIENSLILIKGSRAIGLENLVDCL